MSEKPHLVLDWVLNVTTQELSCTIDENLKYLAYKGGTEGYTKLTRTSVSDEWTETFIPDMKAWTEEKYWISENYGERLGYFQYDPDRFVEHPIQKRPDKCVNGVGPDGRYLDHMQRMQILLEGEDVSFIYETEDHHTFYTPDGGKTILKAIPLPFDKLNYQNKDIDPRDWRPAHPQPCAMFPISPGRFKSSYDEMLSMGVPVHLVDKCKDQKWVLPKHPELFTKHYVY